MSDGTREFPGFRVAGAPVFTRAEGAHLYDNAGRRYLDLAAGFGVYLHGHGAQAPLLRAFADDSPAPGLGDLYAHDLRDRACTRLTSVAAANGMGRADELRALVLHSGSEAVETAIKTALLATGRERIVAFDGAYHGTFGLALAASSRADFRDPFASQYAATVAFHPYGELPPLDERVACVIVEPVLGRAGVFLPPDGYLHALRQACDEAGALLIVDAVLVGCGRTGIPMHGAGCGPDLLCLGKALGAGIPASAVVAQANVAGAAWGVDPGEAIHTATFLGHPLACAAIERTLGELLPAADLTAEHDAWHDTLTTIADEHALQLRGLGLLWALDTGRPGDGFALSQRLLQEGTVVTPSGANASSITLTPPLAVDAEQRDLLSGALRVAQAQPSM